MKPRLLLTAGIALALAATACARPTPTPTLAPGPVATPLPTTPPPGVAATPTPPPPPGVRQPTGELRIAVGYMGNESLDPILGPASGMVTLAEQVYDYVVGVAPDGKLSTETGLAFKWEMTPDAKKWTFSFRKGVKFHNGDEVTAEDAKFSIERVLTPKSVATNTAIFRASIDKMEVPDPYTLIVYTKKPLPLFPYYLSEQMPGAEGMVLPKKYIQQVGDEGFAQKPVGSGPYKFKEQVFGSYVKYEAVDNHWRAGVPRFKTITLLAIPESTTRVAALKLGQADIIELERDAISEVKKAGLPIIQQLNSDDLRVLIHQQWDKGPLNDKRVRLALLLGMNRPEIIEHIFEGTGQVGVVAFMAPFTLGADPTLKPYPYDPEQAKKLLAEAGYKDGFTLNMYAFQRPGFPELPKVVEAVAGYYERIGVKGKIIPMDYGGFRPLWVGKKLAGGALSLSTAATRVVSQPSHLRYHNFKDILALADRPDIHSIVEQAGNALTLEETERLMRQAHKLMYDEVTFPSLAMLSRVYAMGSKLESWTPRQVPYSLSLDMVVARR